MVKTNHCRDQAVSTYTATIIEAKTLMKQLLRGLGANLYGQNHCGQKFKKTTFGGTVLGQKDTSCVAISYKETTVVEATYV